MLRPRSLVLSLPVLVGCLIPAKPPVDRVDRDGDGAPASEDCDDADPARHDGAVELCDGIDNDCDGLIDERLAITWFRDGDGDGFGGEVEAGCAPPADAVSVGGDCDDADSDRYPGAPEGCGDGDRNCDGVDGAPEGPFYADADGDGFGDPGSTPVYACDPPTGHVLDATDCDDGDSAVWPGAPERCDGVDRDCDGQVSPLGGPWYEDGDGDGYGSPAVVDRGCVAPVGFVGDGTDCDDGAGAVHPGAAELCNGIDDNCDPADDLLDGDDPSCAVDDCGELQLVRPTAPDGVYWIDPAGLGPFEAACDMSRQGGGWTLVYAYTFTAYAAFTSGANAVTPIPSWPVTSSDQPVSTRAPLAELDFAALEHALWGDIGEELFVVSTIQDWMVCSPGTGSITVPNTGSMICTNVADVAPACSGLAPTTLWAYGYGWALTGSSIFTYWDGSSVANWPTHDPCGLNQANQLTGVLDPRGAIYLR